MNNEYRNNQNVILPRYKNGAMWVGRVAKDRGYNETLADNFLSLRNKHDPGCSK